MQNYRNKSVSTHQFTMVPRPDVPRSQIRMQKGLKTSFDAGLLIPVYLQEVLPGDTFRVSMTAFARLSTPLFPFMDNLYCDSFFFFCPNRLVWKNWVKMMGEQDAPGDSIQYGVPQIQSPPNGYAVGSLGDYFGLQTVGQIEAGRSFGHSVLPFRMYNLIWNHWFRDENLQGPAAVDLGDGPEATGASYPVLQRGKRHDYFTSCLPWPQKGAAVTIPMGTSAPVRTQATEHTTTGVSGLMFRTTAGGVPTSGQALGITGGLLGTTSTTATATNASVGPTNLYADLSAASAATINQLRMAFQIQKLLERDARGGTRYVELIRSHFGVVNPDQRLQRPEYLGGGSTLIAVNPIAQTSATDVTGSSTPLGGLGAAASFLTRGHGFTYSAVEHGYIIGLVNVRADLTYQQGCRRHWFRQTRYDFYMPVFANLGEQAVLNKEIYTTGDPAKDELVFGYQERWSEHRYSPSEITGHMRSTAAQTLDAWHLSQKFSAVPVLNASFIVDNPPIPRVLAVAPAVSAAAFIMDAFFDVVAARPIPMFSVPGLVDHF